MEKVLYTRSLVPSATARIYMYVYGSTSYYTI